ncbi:MAG: two-component regulator propeller domain-containing protein, partial [Pyrinomonadaceae bacterium]
PMFAEPLRGEDGTPLNIDCLIQDGSRLLACTNGLGVVGVTDGAVTVLNTAPRPLFVKSLAESRDGQLWFGTGAAKSVSGVYARDQSSKAVRIPAPTADVLTLEANEGGVWAGTERYGLFQFADSKLKKTYTFENTSGGLRSNTIFTLFTDREGVLWIGTNRGVSRFDSLGASQETLSDIPNSNFIRSLFSLDGENALAGSNRGLFRSDGKGWTPVPGFEGKVIYSVARHKNGEILIATPSGAFTSSGKLIAPGDFRSFANFRSRTYAAVYDRGIVAIAPNASDISSVVAPSDPLVTAICEGADRLWIGTAENGLFSFDGKSTKTELRLDILKSGTIWRIYSGNDGALWIAGQHGVFRIRDGQVEKIIDAEDVRDVVVDHGEVWAATTTRGLLHARQDEQFGWLVSSIGFEQGLPSEKAFAILPSAAGHLIATNRGVVTYRPGTIAPKLIATRVLSQRPHDLSELNSTIALDYPQNTLLVEVAGQSSRTFPEEFQYAFSLKNGKGETIDRRLSNEAQYAPADLSPGDFTIESIAFNRDLLASEPLMIRFSVAKAPFPWTATALGVLLVMALVGLIWAIVEHRRIAHRNRELAAARLDLANEAERERRRIARDLHDQTLADLRNLMITSDKLAGDNREFRSEIEAVSTEIRRICEDLSPSVLENVGLVAALEFLLDRTVENRRFNAAESVEDRITFPLNVQLQIYRIAQEVLTNIVRHSSATEVEMNIEVPAAGDFSLTIRDNGGTFDPDGTQKGRGIANIRSRANLINGKVNWKESRSGGNIFSLKVGATNGDR